MLKKENGQKAYEFVWEKLSFFVLVILSLWMKFDRFRSLKMTAGIMLLLLFCVAAYMLLKKINLQMVDGKNEYIYQFFLLSPFVFLSIYYSVNIEMTGICFFLAGLFYLYKGQEKLAYILFVLAIGTSTVYLTLTVMVFLIWTKKVKEIILKAGTISIVGLAMQMLVVHILPSGVEMGNIFWVATLNKGFPAIAGKNASYFMFGMVTAFFAGYFLTEEKKKKHIHYMLMVLGFIWMCFGSFEHYYVAIAIPFILLVMADNRKCFRINMILYLVFNVCGILCAVWNKIEFIFSIQYMEYYISAVGACFVGAALLICLVNYPRKQIIKMYTNTKCEWWLLLLNVLMIYPIAFVVLRYGIQ